MKLTAKQYLTQRGLKDANDKGDFDNISPNKARQILHDKKVNGKSLTPEQFRLFGFLSKGHTLKFQMGGKNPYASGGNVYDFLFDDEEEFDEPYKKPDNTAPDEEELAQAGIRDNQDYEMAMQIAQMEYRPRDKRVNGVNPYTSPSNSLNPDTYLTAIFGNEGGKTGVDPSNVRGTASGKYAIIKSGRQDLYNMFYSNQMTYNEFEKQYNSNPAFEYQVARKLAQINISKSKTAGEAIGRWYDPKTAESGNWGTVPRPDYGNRLTMQQYIQRALKNIQ